MESIFLFFLSDFVIAAVFLILSIAYTFAVENDKYIWSVFLSIVAIIAYYEPIWNFLTSGLNVLWLFGGYIIVGALYSIPKYFRFCSKWIKENPTKPSHYKKLTREQYYKQQLSGHKHMIISWMVFWPWSLWWMVFGDIFTFIGKIFKRIYYALRKVYDKIADYAIKRAMNK